MNKVESKPLQYKDLPSFIKQRLWNNKSLTIQVTRDRLDEPYIEVKIIKDERNNIESPK
jgi:hypothetical protein